MFKDFNKFVFMATRKGKWPNLQETFTMKNWQAASEQGSSDLHQGCLIRKGRIYRRGHTLFILNYSIFLTVWQEKGQLQPWKLCSVFSCWFWTSILTFKLRCFLSLRQACISIYKSSLVSYAQRHVISASCRKAMFPKTEMKSKIHSAAGTEQRQQTERHNNNIVLILGNTERLFF